MSSTDGPDLAEAPEERCFLSTAEAAALERELLEDYRFGRQQLVEWCGHASAVAVTKVFPLPALPRKQRTALVVCGPEQNGAVGLACARHLRVFEYEPTIFYPTRSADPLHRDLTTQCEKMDIPFLSYLPAEVSLGGSRGVVGDRASRLPRPCLCLGLPGPAHQQRIQAGGGRCAGPWCGAGRGRGSLHTRTGHTQATVHPACELGHPLRLGPRDWRRRRGRAATRRARIAGGAQALRRPLLRAPPLRGGQVRARRRAPKVRSAPAGVHGHRLYRGALTGARANKQTHHHCPLAWASSVRRVCRGGGQPGAGGLPTGRPVAQGGRDGGQTHMGLPAGLRENWSCMSGGWIPGGIDCQPPRGDLKPTDSK
uniref:YjeF N-terminal domain-containing protein n=1 Tax=Capra hircus TaxID=9925 RepID=A0A8C2P0B9_CAPHI